jgi:hypothetical protein
MSWFAISTICPGLLAPRQEKYRRVAAPFGSFQTATRFPFCCPEA